MLIVDFLAPIFLYTLLLSLDNLMMSERKSFHTALKSILHIKPIYK